MDENGNNPTQALAQKLQAIVNAINAGRKIDAIREVRQAFGLGLKDAKDFVETGKLPWQPASPVSEAAIHNELNGLKADVQRVMAANEELRWYRDEYYTVCGKMDQQRGEIHDLHKAIKVLSAALPD